MELKFFRLCELDHDKLIQRLTPSSEGIYSHPDFTVAVLPFGWNARGELHILHEVLTRWFRVKMLPLAPAKLAVDWLDGSRGQYSGDKILDALFELLPTDASRILGVLSNDLFAAGRTFVYGYAHLWDQVAVYSCHRFPEAWHRRRSDPKLERDRTTRTALHEIGHTFGLPHCDETGCVMHAVNGTDIEIIDRLNLTYCSSCWQRVHAGMRIAPTSIEGLFLRAGSLMRRKRYSEASRLYLAAAREAQPLDPQAWNNLGVSLALGPAYGRQDAEQVFHYAIQLVGGLRQPEPFYNLGVFLANTAPKAGREWLEQGFERDPEKLEAHAYLGKVYDEYLLYPDAERHFRAYVACGGQDDDVLKRARDHGINVERVRAAAGR